MTTNHVNVLAHAIWGTNADVSGGCCRNPMLSELAHPFYRCQSCQKKVQLVKVTKIRVKVVDESSDSHESRIK